MDLTKEPWLVWLGDCDDAQARQAARQVMLPGTLDEYGLGGPDRLDMSCHPDEGTGQTFDEDVIATRYTRKHTYEGPACFMRRISCRPAAGKRIFLEVERARCLRLLVDGREAVHEEAPISVPLTCLKLPGC